MGSKYKRALAFLSSKIIFIILGILSIIISLISTYFLDIIPAKAEPNDLSQRIEYASIELKSLSTELESIQGELESRIEFVDKLKTEAENAEAMISLSKEQVDAIKAALNSELSKNDSKNFWISFATNFFFMVLGSAFTYFITWLYKKLKKKAR